MFFGNVIFGYSGSRLILKVFILHPSRLLSDFQIDNESTSEALMLVVFELATLDSQCPFRGSLG